MACGWLTGLWIGRSGFEPWPGHCVVFTLLSQCLSPPGGINGYRQTVRENLTKSWEVTCNGLASNPGGEAILQSLNAIEKVKCEDQPSSSCVGHWAGVQTLPFYQKQLCDLNTTKNLTPTFINNKLLYCYCNTANCTCYSHWIQLPAKSKFLKITVNNKLKLQQTTVSFITHLPILCPNTPF